MKITGGCRCGRIAYEATIDPNAVGICHCTDCQSLSGSAYRVTVPARADAFVIRGEPKIYVKTAASGTKRAQAFCPDCGAAIYAAAVSNPPSYSLRVGSISQRVELGAPKRQIWCQSALPWSMDLRAVEQYPRQS
ncbi:MAG: GFA family protein [Alphaproteobacteria bacterium]|nr:GFA family protein [Alphaproteobacteria bacterium]